jgi:hypothetical protein
MGRSTTLAHGEHCVASFLKASPKGEGVHPSQNETLKKERIKKQIYKNCELALVDLADYFDTFYKSCAATVISAG